MTTLSNEKIPERIKGLSWDDIVILAATVYGEARGEIFKGKTAVAWTIRNRAEKKNWFGSGIQGVCKKPFQYSCWNHMDPNYARCTEFVSAFKDTNNSFAKLMINDVSVHDCLTVALLVLTGRVKDETSGSTHYHTTKVNPTWSKDKKPVVQIGNHLFFNNID